MSLKILTELFSLVATGDRCVNEYLPTYLLFGYVAESSRYMEYRILRSSCRYIILQKLCRWVSTPTFDDSLFNALVWSLRQARRTRDAVVWSGKSAHRQNVCQRVILPGGYLFSGHDISTWDRYYLIHKIKRVCPIVTQVCHNTYAIDSITLLPQ